MIDHLMAELYNQQMIESLKRWGIRFRKPRAYTQGSCVYVYKFQEELLMLAGFRPGSVKESTKQAITYGGKTHYYPVEQHLASLDVRRPWGRWGEHWYLPSQDPFGAHQLTLNWRYWDCYQYYDRRRDAIVAYTRGRQPLPVGLAASLAAGYRYDEFGRPVTVPGSPAEPPAPKSSWLPQRQHLSPLPQSECSEPSPQDPCAHQSADEQSTPRATEESLRSAGSEQESLSGIGTGQTVLSH